MTEQRSFLFSQIQRPRRTHQHAGRDFADALALDAAVAFLDFAVTVQGNGPHTAGVQALAAAVAALP